MEMNIQERQKQTSSTAIDLDVTVRMDAVKIAGDEFWKRGFEQLEGYRCAYDYRLPGSPTERAYGRVCQFVSEKNGLKLGISYNPTNGWMPRCMVTLSPNDQTGLSRSELEQVLELLPNHRFLKLELAHDFCSESVVDSRFARKHLVIGKSQRTEDPAHPGMLYFGARRSPVFARCYEKEAIDCFRIELEYHSEWIVMHRIKTPRDFVRLPELTARIHIAFYKIDPLKLSAALARLGVPVASTMRKVILRQDDLSVALRFLRKNVGLPNAIRVLTPLATNGRVERALHIWARQWERQAQRGAA
jgi:hypothetical protein